MRPRCDSQFAIHRGSARTHEVSTGVRLADALSLYRTMANTPRFVLSFRPAQLQWRPFRSLVGHSCRLSSPLPTQYVLFVHYQFRLSLS